MLCVFTKVDMCFRWIAGISTVHHPFVWAAGIRYLMNIALLERCVCVLVLCLS